LSELEELLGRVAAVSGRLLRVEREPALAGAAPGASAALRLTFDVGRLELRSAPGEELSVEVLEAGAPRHPGLLAADEDEPWWRLLGFPVARVLGPDPARLPRAALRLQFRRDDETPRVVALSVEGGWLQARLERAAASRH
jgi:hypothetical protein